MTNLVLNQTELNRRYANTSSGSACKGVPYSPIPAPSPVFTLCGRSNNYGKGRGGSQIRMIVDHTTEGSSSSIVGSMKYDATRAETVSATAFTGEDGIGISVPELDRPWTNGMWNAVSLTNETVGKAAWTESQWRETRPNTIVNKIILFHDWCRRHGIPAIWLEPDDIVRGLRGITDHYTANQAAIAMGGSPGTYSHWDVGPGMRAVLKNTIIPAVAQLLAGSSTVEIDMSTMTGFVPPSRRYSTRGSDGAPHGAVEGKGFFGKGTTRFCPLGLPASAQMAVINLTVVSPAERGYLTVWGTGARPTTANVNFQKGVELSNLAIVPVHNGGVTVYAHEPCDLIIDVQATIG